MGPGTQPAKVADEGFLTGLWVLFPCSPVSLCLCAQRLARRCVCRCGRCAGPRRCGGVSLGGSLAQPLRL